ncbi:hypothetical protein EDD18DRAFT_228658 [Armillaria luteobubalina]|uniref:Uncharacterized protein n=1 Tax=Armillaria luteobubalina TaxID=153913 RepID=A0AA39TNN4_9AGAR|nr:hypothetical protein EDD18DRAFT_228658 [Armillaria luteobubalina]
MPQTVGRRVKMMCVFRFICPRVSSCWLSTCNLLSLLFSFACVSHNISRSSDLRNNPPPVENWKHIDLGKIGDTKSYFQRYVEDVPPTRDGNFDIALRFGINSSRLIITWGVTWCKGNVSLVTCRFRSHLLSTPTIYN